MKTQFLISNDHPALSGHFPGHPVVPAVVLLQKLESLVIENFPGYRLQEIVQAKFMQPVLPEEEIRIDAIENPVDERRFKLSFSLYGADESLRAKGICLFERQGD